MEITIYRGTHEIGGTLIELKTEGSRILIDAGYPLFLNGTPIDNKLVSLPSDELLELGVLPKISGLYKWDVPGFNAIILSHAHMDHCGLLPYIHLNIPVYLSAGTLRLIEISKAFRLFMEFPINGRVFKMYESFAVGDFEIKPFLMDHSAFDAAAFVISDREKTVIYTGDFRGHGRKSVCLDHFIHGAKKQADLLLCEGSMLGRLGEEVLTEEELETKATGLIQNTDGITLFQSSSQNIDRLVSFYKAARSTRRLFIIDVYTANVLFELRQLGNHLPYPSKTYPEIHVFYPYNLTNKIFKNICPEFANRFSAFYISKGVITQKQRQIVMAVRPSMLSDLKRCSLTAGSFIYSMWQGYRNTEYQKHFEAYLSKIGFDSHFLHTSGHAKVEDIQSVMTELNPKKIIPIHTMFPEAFFNFSEKVKLAQDGIGISI